MTDEALLREVSPDPERLAMLAPCIDNYGVGDADAEWPNNLISRHAIAYESGRLARRGERVRHAIDPSELERCRALAREIAGLVEDMEVGMGSEASDGFHPYWLVPNADERPSIRIDEELVLRAFGGTLFPLATITVEPLREEGIWWSQVEDDGEESESSYFVPWREMIAWFASKEDFVDRAFVCVDVREALWEAEARGDALPPGTEIPGCVLPRLALGLTRGGSLVGLFGWTVQT